MNELQKLLNVSKTNAIKIVKITKRHSRTSFVVIDIQQRTFLVESDGSYLPGQTVIIKDGVIISRTKSLTAFKSYEV